MYLRQYALTFLVAFGLAALLTPLAGHLGHRLGIVDRPGGRRGHRGEIPRLGGIAIFLAFVVAVGVGRSLYIPTADEKEPLRLLGLLAGSAFLSLVGLVDDRWELRPLPQFVAQMIAAVIAIATLIIVERFNNPLTNEMVILPPIYYVPLTVFWIVGMINTVNWLDGLGGLAAGVGAVLCLVLAIHMHRVGQPSVALLPLALLGALLGFLPYNVAPSRVFLGSAGAFFLGYALGGLGLIAGGRVATVLLVMGLPIVDVAWQIFDRLRHHRSPAQADRGHLHFRLLDLGLSERAIVLIYWGFCALFGVLALTVSSRLYKLLALVGIGVMVVCVLVWLSRSER
ncbi:MAG: undecaprenyl/decaprenyl-phosphate alpha-N-acetylglucosaminyl 1-phosphate transferase [Chloroflexi bacterium]|nr:MAG: undecaprenyl/decaprenyl-phosphate alpha-N-acetylglucosaminyl 1-phosphate transferase [Chloroflexota bacterium]RLC90218.1 MAG: undecaprenyl/decaprenyl-phosphate alpha-N-acetylglucosaminyl 1-phosphate transferase [Chloroflexota bacterium]HEY67581.1 undecaprenyl/decaprenyl-phosphate alpha-N-acetylglucosaminyl 1-phosphate transferase [Thermoflexia bacterium]